MAEWWVPILTALIAGVTSVPVWNSLQRMLGRGATEIDRLRLRLREVEGHHVTCEQKVDDLTKRLVQVEAHHASHFARWIVDASKRVIWLNAKALLAVFAPLGLTRDGVEGRLFGEMIAPDAAIEINRLDQAALSSPGAAVSALLQLHPDLPVMHVVTVAATGREGELIYESMTFHANDPEVAIGMGIARQATQRARSIDGLAGDSRSTGSAD